MIKLDVTLNTQSGREGLTRRQAVQCIRQWRALGFKPRLARTLRPSAWARNYGASGLRCRVYAVEGAELTVSN